MVLGVGRVDSGMINMIKSLLINSKFIAEFRRKSFIDFTNSK